MITKGENLFTDILLSLQERIADNDVRFLVYSDLIVLLEQSGVVTTLSWLKGGDPVFDKAYDEVGNGG